MGKVSCLLKAIPRSIKMEKSCSQKALGEDSRSPLAVITLNRQLV